MADTTFVNGVTLTDADWFNDVNRLQYTILGDPASLTVLRATLANTGTHATTFTFNGSGGTSASKTLTYSVWGSMVTLNIPATTATSGTSSTTFTGDTALAVALRPSAATQAAFVPALNNNAAVTTPGYVTITTAGVITIQRDPAATAYTNSTTCGTAAAISITYFVG